VSLSPTEKTIAACIAGGKRNVEIAAEPGTTAEAVKLRLTEIYRKLGVSDRLELALYLLHHPTEIQR